jgi:hypothetical protein
MKVRSGFVSNSSTSSFIAVGFKFPSKPKKIPEKYQDMIRHDSDGGDYYFVSEVISFDYGEEFDFAEYQRKFEKATAVAEKAMDHFNVTDSKIAVYGNTTDQGGYSWLGYYDEDDEEDDEEDEETEEEEQ